MRVSSKFRVQGFSNFYTACCSLATSLTAKLTVGVWSTNKPMNLLVQLKALFKQSFSFCCLHIDIMRPRQHLTAYQQSLSIARLVRQKWPLSLECHPVSSTLQHRYIEWKSPNMWNLLSMYRANRLVDVCLNVVPTSPPVDGSGPEYLLSQTTSSMNLAGSAETEGKWREQSSAKKRKTFQLRPKSFERSINMAAGLKLCRKTQRRHSHTITKKWPSQ